MGGCGFPEKKRFLTISILNISDFYLFQHCEDVGCLEQSWFLTVSTFDGRGGIDRSEFVTVSTYLGCGGLERRDI